VPAARDDIGTLVPALESKQAVLTCRAAFALEIGVTDTLATAIAPYSILRRGQQACKAARECRYWRNFIGQRTPSCERLMAERQLSKPFFSGPKLFED
jgi:hypothetical protein